MSLRIPPALPQWAQLVKTSALNRDLDPSLLLAVVWQESSGDPRAVREEPGFVWFYSPARGPLRDPRLTTEQNRDKALKILGVEEFNFQTCSHGLCQIMGSVARELGYTGNREAFYAPGRNLRYGAVYLQLCLKRAQGDLRQGLLRWNGGGRSAYPDEVLEKYEILKEIAT